MTLHRMTGIARPTIDGYLSEMEPGLAAVGKIASALGVEPWELLKPTGKDPVLSRSVRECIAALTALAATDADQADALAALLLNAIPAARAKGEAG